MKILAITCQPLTVCTVHALSEWKSLQFARTLLAVQALTLTQLRLTE